MEYQAVFIFWLLSFTASPEQCTKVEQVMNDVEVARRMTAILREIPAEKVKPICAGANPLPLFLVVFFLDADL